MLFFKYPKLYGKIDDNWKKKIRIECGKNHNYFLLADFLNDDIEKHLEEAEKIRIKNDEEGYYDASVIVSLFNKYEKSDAFITFLFQSVIKSKSYRQSLNVLRYVLPDILNGFTKEQCEKLMEIFNTCNQYYGLGGCSGSGFEYLTLEDYLKNLKPILDEKLGKDFDYSVYENIKDFS